MKKKLTLILRRIFSKNNIDNEYTPIISGGFIYEDYCKCNKFTPKSIKGFMLNDCERCGKQKMPIIFKK